MMTVMFKKAMLESVLSLKIIINMNGTLWILIIITSWIVGAIIYFIIRDDESAVECPNCQTVVKGNNAFCPKCGTEVKR